MYVSIPDHFLAQAAVVIVGQISSKNLQQFDSLHQRQLLHLIRQTQPLFPWNIYYLIFTGFTNQSD